MPFLQLSGIYEVRVILANKLCHIDLPRAIAFGSIDNLLAVGANIYVTLLLGSVGDTLSCLILCMGDVDIPMCNEGNLLVAWGNSEGRDFARQPLLIDLLLLFVTDEGDGYLLRFAPRGKSVDLAIIAEAECPVLCTREEANGILGESRDALIAG